MSIIQILFLALALSMDAFAVSVSSCTCKQANFRKQALWTSASFGLFQAIMPLLGWTVGRFGAHFLESIDHWVAFGLLAFVGLKMVKEGFAKDEDENCDISKPFSWRTLIMLSVATSIDAAAVGISLSLIDTPILFPAIVIGVVTFTLSWLGHHFGRMLGERFGKGAEIVGGLVLVGIGVKILLQHFGGNG